MKITRMTLLELSDAMQRGDLTSREVTQAKKFFFENRNNTIYALGRMGSTVCCGVLLVISSILLVDSTNNPFLYWRF